MKHITLYVAIVNFHSRICTKLESENLDLHGGSVTSASQGKVA